MKKKILAFITALGLIPSVLPVNAAQIGKCGENLMWTLADGILTISGKGAMEDYTLFCKDWNDYTKTLPPWYGPDPDITTLIVEEGVTSIGDFAFEGLSRLASVTLPDTITKIGESAFSGCSFAEISIPNVTYIDDGAFAECEELKSISIPSGVTSINDSTFSFCTSLTSVEIPDSVTEIESSAFTYCENLSEIALPAELTKIGEHAFSNTALSAIHIPDSVTFIGTSAFNSCDNLTEITYPEAAELGIWAFDGLDFDTQADEYGVVYYNNHLLSGDPGLSGEYAVKYGTAFLDEIAFWNNTGLTSVVLPNTVTHIGAHTFGECTKLENINIPNSVTEIGRYAFDNCTHLKSIYIPSTVTEIGRKAFLRCIRLEDIYFEGTPEQWEEITSGGSVLGMGSENASIHYNCEPIENPATPKPDNTIEDTIINYGPESIVKPVDGGYILDLNIHRTDYCSKVIAAHYKDGKLINVEANAPTSHIVSFNIAADTDEVKVWTFKDKLEYADTVDVKFLTMVLNDTE